MTDFNDNLEQSSALVARSLQETDSSTVIKATEYADQIMRNLKSGRGSGILPDSVKTAIIQGDASLVQAEFEFLRKALTMVRQTQLDNLRESCNQHLLRMKADRRGKDAQFLSNRITELLKEIDRNTDDVFDFIDQKLQEAERLKSSKLREMRIKELERKIDEFQDSQNKLVKKVLSITDESL